MATNCSGWDTKTLSRLRLWLSGADYSEPVTTGLRWLSHSVSLDRNHDFHQTSIIHISRNLVTLGTSFILT